MKDIDIMSMPSGWSCAQVQELQDEIKELEAKNVELEKKLAMTDKKLEISTRLNNLLPEHVLEKKLEIAVDELGAHCAWENTKEDCDCSACESIKKIKGASNE